MLEYLLRYTILDNKLVLSLLYSSNQSVKNYQPNLWEALYFNPSSNFILYFSDSFRFLFVFRFSILFDFLLSENFHYVQNFQYDLYQDFRFILKVSSQNQTTFLPFFYQNFS